jgi:hypothetical protein
VSLTVASNYRVVLSDRDGGVVYIDGEGDYKNMWTDFGTFSSNDNITLFRNWQRPPSRSSAKTKADIESIISYLEAEDVKARCMLRMRAGD